ncbi:sin3 histone deacetylase corepressor complex component SDS3 isoform X2 [Cimex lectularius]|uniref:Sin3 histone deacetylase corepressor complex component SDS3 n=1 Tax=Cimex lectularius TaxID=79782 RepID=A0A8I6R7D3_CIMLE|nr:sin3 histone deacetylase corepressor complex component SDS3 isoform X2 [Cimex lectularius]
MLLKMSYNNFYASSNHTNDEYEFYDENDDLDEEGDAEQDESDEDTEEASETELRKSDSYREVPDVKDQLFRYQLQQLHEGTYPEYLRRLKRLEQQFKERIQLNKSWREHLIELTEKDYISEKRSAAKEFDERSIELKENLIQDMDEKKKIVESERVSMELSGDSTEAKPAMTRKLRRRPNDPAPIPEKRRGKLTSLPSQISYLLDEKEIESDLKAISRGIKSGVSVRKPANGLQALGPIIPDPPTSEIRIEDGKLLYEKKWFHRGQTVFVEGKDMPKFPAIISAIGSEAISVKKTIDSSKVKIYMNQLVRGKIIIKRRAS